MVSVEVPLNTMLADLDETLREMLKGELERHGFEGIEIAFDAPTREWSGQLSQPSVNLFLYDLRESEEQRPSGWTDAQSATTVVEARAADGDGGLLRDHRVGAGRRGRAPAALAGARGALRLPRAAGGVLDGRLRNGSQPLPIKAKVGQAKGDKADFWTRGRRPVQGVARLRGAPRRRVRRLAREPAGPHADDPHAALDGPPRAVVEMHRSGGTVAGADGEPVADAWVTLPEIGRWRPRTPTAASSSTASARGATACWPARPTAREARPSSSVPARVDLVGRRRPPARKAGRG